MKNKHHINSFESATDWVNKALKDNFIESEFGFAKPGLWREVCGKLSYMPVAVSQSMLEYQEEYFSAAGKCYNISLIIKSDGRPVGLWPLSLSVSGECPNISVFGNPVGAPIFIDDVSLKTQKKICSRVIMLLKQLGGDLGLDYINCEQAVYPPYVNYGCTEWEQQLMANKSGSSVIRYDLFADLSPEINSIRAAFRKSYKPLINMALRMWDVNVMSALTADINIWNEFKQLHREVSGRITRSDKTWLLQWEMLCGNEAFLVVLRDPEGKKMIGAGFFQYTRDEGLYSVAAYDRDLFDKPLGHVVQYRAIEIMKLLNVRWYQIGERHYEQSNYQPSEKEINISNFKQGFSSNMFSRHQVRLPI